MNNNPLPLTEATAAESALTFNDGVTSSSADDATTDKRDLNSLQ